MPDFNVRSDSVNVELIMEQIRERIREKRGVDYTEQQIRDLAAVKLEKFLDPSGVRSDLLDRFRKAQPAYEPPELPNFAFEDATLFESHRAPIRWIRKLLMPLLKLLFNPNPLIQALNIQSRLNTMNAEREARRESARRALDQLYYELIHNLVIETTRLGIDVKNLKMRLESVSSRLEFNERRARALESVVVYKSTEPEERPAQRAPAQTPHRPSAQPVHAQQAHSAPARSAPPPPPALPPPTIAAVPVPGQGQEPPDGSGQGAPAEGPGQRSRRRRRRRGRRGGGSAAAIIGTPGTPSDAAAAADSTEQMDAMDRMDDDGSPESEDAHAAAAESLDQSVSAQAEHVDPVVDSSATPSTQIAPEPTHSTTVASASSSAPPPSASAEEETPSATLGQAPTPSSETAPAALRPLESLGVAPSQVEGREPQNPPGDNRGTTGAGQISSPPQESQGHPEPEQDRGVTSSGHVASDPDAQ
jgi:hypothetical protein